MRTKKEIMEEIKVKRFGEIGETWGIVTRGKKEDYISLWVCKYGDDFEEPKESSFIIRLVFNKDDFPTKKDIPKFRRYRLQKLDKTKKCRGKN